MLFLAHLFAAYEYALVSPWPGEAVMGPGASVWAPFNPAAGPGDLAFSYAKYSQGIHLGGFSAPLGSFGVSGSYLLSPGMVWTDTLGNQLGTFGYHGIALAAWRAFPISFPRGHLSLGVGPELMYQGFLDYRTLAVGLCLGLLWRQGGLRAGLSVRHLGYELLSPEQKYHPTPRLGFGLGWQTEDLALSLGAGKEPGAKAYLGAGASWWVYGWPFALSVGYSTLGREWDLGVGEDILNGLSLGFGVRARGLVVRYTWTPMGGMGDAHRFSVCRE